VTGAVFVLPATTAGEQGPVAAWVSTAGWATAARRVLGASWIVTPSGLVEPVDARARGTARHLASNAAPSWRRRVPVSVKTLAKDLRQWQRARAFRIGPDGPWSSTPLTFVWQRHELFHRAGIDLARALQVPSVVFVPAPLVWERERWGTARPRWADALERLGEQRALRDTDLVACGSTDVVEQVTRMGVPEARTIITPTGVDLDLFENIGDPGALRHRLGLDGQFVVGWVGSFRRFHAIEQVVAAMVGVDGATLLMVGDGPERPRIEALARSKNVAAVFTGTVPHDELPLHLAAMDAALIVAAPDAAFHYSPLKLAEYLAAGLPVVAPRLGQPGARLTDGLDAILVDAGDVAAISAALRDLRDAPDRRAALGLAARASAAATWSWDEQVRRVSAALESRSPSER
jgi:glycosyltransferase involved in cell wall biosynthesis